MFDCSQREAGNWHPWQKLFYLKAHSLCYIMLGFIVINLRPHMHMTTGCCMEQSIWCGTAVAGTQPIFSCNKHHYLNHHRHRYRHYNQYHHHQIYTLCSLPLTTAKYRRYYIINDICDSYDQMQNIHQKHHHALCRTAWWSRSKSLWAGPVNALLGQMISTYYQSPSHNRELSKPIKLLSSSHLDYPFP